MGILKTLELRDSAFQPYLNTGTLFDIQTGVFVPGTHGGMVLNGGLSTTNGFIGRPQMFKSTKMFSYMMRALAIYSGSEAIIYDTEYSQKKERLKLFAPWLDPDLLEDRLVINTPADTTPEEFFEHLKKVVEEKTKHRDDYLRKTPILDPRTNQPLMMLEPTFVSYDSWSKLVSSIMQTTLDTKTLGSSDTNMIYMKDGNIKKMMMTQLPTMAVRGGIVFLLSAHVGDKYEMNPYAPSPKSLQYMKASDKPKEVGSDFNFLISNNVEMRSVKVMQAEKDEGLYPTDGSSPVELNEVTAIMLRCKNNVSGSTLPTVVSQTNGILADLTNYHYVRDNNYFGLLGNKVTHKPAMTDISVGRTTIRKKLEDPKLCRALSLLAQLCYIQQNWVTTGGDVDFSIKPEALAEKLLGSDGPTVSDILESRGTWTYDESPQPYLSLYDVVAIAQGHYKAKGIVLCAPPAEPSKAKKA